MTLYKESIAHEIEADLNGRNQNWTTIDTHLAESANKAHGGFKGALLRKGVVQSIPNDATITLAWNNVVYDVFGFYNAGNPTRITVPEGVSKIKLLASVGFSDNGAGRREIHIFKNGNGNYNGRSTATAVPITGTAPILQAISPVINVDAGDYFEVVAFQNSGESINVTDWYNAWFAIEAIE